MKAGQTAAKARDEEARAKLSAELKAVYDGTKADVDKVLGELDGQVGAAFDQGEAQAKAAFTADHQARMQRYKDERYAGVSGAARWVADKFTGLPAEAGQIFQLSRALYESRMRAVISDVADLIGRQLTAAKARIARGREEIAGIVARQPRELQRFAADAAREFGGRFTELESAVDDKSKALVDDLAQRYTAARGAVDDEIKALQAENKGLLDAAMDALAETAATIKQLADMLASVAARAAGAVDRIIAKPIEFLGNLVNAVKSGVLGFAERAGEHLKQGLKDWLLGQLAAGGIELPETLDAKGILRLVLSILGLTWANIRARVVRQIPEPAMRALEGSFEMVRVLMSEGVGGLWRWILGKLGDLKDTVIGAIKDFVLEKIVTAGVTWIVSLLNPASAFVRACKAIYDVIMFFVHQAARLKDFVDTVLDSIEGIAAGTGGGIPAKIEAALAKALPLVLDFLASLLGLGGISEKIRGILEKVQAPVTKAVDWVIGKIVAAGKAAWRGLKRGGAKAVDSVKGAKDALLAKLRVRKPVPMGGNTHHVYLEERGGRNVLMMASTPGLLLVKIDKALSNETVRSKRKVVSELQAARIRISVFQESVQAAKDESSKPKIRAAESALVAELDRIAARLAEIGATFDIDDLKGTKWTLDGKIRDGIDIRAKFYGPSTLYQVHRGVTLGQGHRDKIARKAQFGLDPGFAKATYYCPGVPRLNRSPHLAPDVDVTLDHNTPVAQHWNDHGRKSGHQPRVDFYTNAAELVAMCGPCNSAKNSDGVKYIREVESGFADKDGNR
ncbi:hypothetical protein [Kitasatospora sp. NPDC093558]|uniref:hypothetical protein n=1 Tax=Kitasatospora sp. NPDC093558 TaxID=3155201 RepID=UPI0034256682